MTRDDLFSYLGFVLFLPILVFCLLGAFRLVFGPIPGPIQHACAEAVKSGRMDENTRKTCQEALR